MPRYVDPITPSDNDEETSSQNSDVPTEIYDDELSSYGSPYSDQETQIDQSYVVEQSSTRVRTINLYRGHLFATSTPTPPTQACLENELQVFVRDQFRHQITKENYNAIQLAWSDYSSGVTLDSIARFDLEQLDVSRMSRDYFVRSLAREYPGMTDQQRAFIRDAFVTTDEFPIHAYRFGAQVGLTELIVEKGNEFFPAALLS